MADDVPPQLLTMADLAQIFRVRPDTIYRRLPKLQADGFPPPVWGRLWDPRAVDRWLRERQGRPAAPAATPAAPEAAPADADRARRLSERAARVAGQVGRRRKAMH
jgi:hypothetical protein